MTSSGGSAAARTYVRYAHPEGHVGLTYVGDDGRLATAGSDGELRLWTGVEDDDPESFPLGETLTALAAAGDRGSERLVVGTDAHAVSMFRLPDVSADGVLTRYTAPVSDICAAGSLVASAGCDMLVRVSSLDGQRQLELDGFTAPVLAVALNPAASVLLTTCCDGSVCFWDARVGRKLASHALLAKCNDITTAPSPARPSWSPDGRSAAVPVENGVRLFGGEDWTERGKLSSELITKPVTACAFSPCGRFLAAATVDGMLVEFRLSGERAARKLDRHESRLRINVLCWHPDGDQLAFTDNAGQLGVTSNVRAGRRGAAASAAAADADTEQLMDMDSLQDAIDDDDDRDLLEAALDGEKNTLDDGKLLDDDDEEDENVISLRKIKAESGFVSDDDSAAAPAAGGRATPAAPAAAPAPVPAGPAFAEPQPAFQPGSTPLHLERRFMVWNSVGVVTAHEGDSIDVEFHDSAVHHPLHLRNALGHTLAALSEHALLLAAPAQDDTPAKLQCLHFGSWDSNKEWYLDLPDGEEPEALALGADWLAVATSQRLLRLLTLTGVQRRVLSLSGAPVCLAGWEDRLLMVTHAGTGLPGEQNLSAQVLTAGGRRTGQAAAPVPVPLAPGARLAWAGFSDQGTPCVSDTSGALRLLTSAAVWTPLEAPRAGSEHLFVVGVSELEQSARGLLCRGSRYPAVLPRPVLSVLPLRLPLAEPDTAHARLEEEAARARLLLDTLARLDAAGFDTAEAAVEPRRARAAALTQLFALAVRTDREHRAEDVAAQMDEVATVEAVAGYASRQRRAVLAQRLMQVAQALADSAAADEEADPEPEPEPERVPRRRHRSEEPPEDDRPERAAAHEEEEEDEEEGDDEEESAPSVPRLPDIAAEKSGDGAGLRGQPEPGMSRLSPACNPFRCQPAKPATQAGKGAAVFDDIKRQQASAKRALPEGKAAKPAGKAKRPRVSKEAAGKVGQSIRHAFAPKPAAEKENCNDAGDKCQPTDDQVSKTAENSAKPAPKVGSGLAKLSNFAFSGK